MRRPLASTSSTSTRTDACRRTADTSWPTSKSRSPEEWKGASPTIRLPVDLRAVDLPRVTVRELITELGVPMTQPQVIRIEHTHDVHLTVKFVDARPVEATRPNLTVV